jgi:hypothetical protein
LRLGPDPYTVADDGSLRGSKGNTVQAEKAEAVAAPATVNGETTPLMITGNREDRRPSLTREPGDLPSLVQPISGEVNRWSVILGRTPAIALFFLNSMRGRHAWNRLDCTE